MNRSCSQCNYTGYFTFSGMVSCTGCQGTGHVRDYAFNAQNVGGYGQPAGFGMCPTCNGSKQSYLSEHRECNLCDKAARMRIGDYNDKKPQEVGGDIERPRPVPPPTMTPGVPRLIDDTGLGPVGLLLWLGGLGWFAYSMPELLPPGVYWQLGAIYGAVGLLVTLAGLVALGPFKNKFPANSPFQEPTRWRHVLMDVLRSATGVALTVAAAAWLARYPAHEFWSTLAAVAGSAVALSYALRLWLPGSLSEVLVGLAFLAFVGTFASHIPGACSSGTVSSGGGWPTCAPMSALEVFNTLHAPTLSTHRDMALLLSLVSIPWRWWVASSRCWQSS